MDHFILSPTGSTRGTAYTMSNKVLTHDGKTHVAWLDQIHKTYVRTLDHATGAWGEPILVGDGKDNHAGAAFAVDSEGRFHLVYGPHNGPISHSISAAPNSVEAWAHQPPFGGTSATYPSLVCDKQDTLHVCYRGAFGDERPRVLMYQRKPKGEGWSGQVALVNPEGPPAYTQYENALHLASDGTLYLAYHIVRAERDDHSRVRGMGFGLMRSADGGKSWTAMSGEPLTLPTTPASPCIIEFDERLDVRVGNAACDAQGNPYFTLHRWEMDVPQTFLYRWRNRCWEGVPLLPEAQKLCEDCAMADVCALSISEDNILYAAAVVCQKGDGWGGPTNAVILLTSRDLGETFSGYRVSPEDPTTPDWLPGLERHTGHNRVKTPYLIYTHGHMGEGLSPDLHTEIRFVSLKEVVRREEEAIRGDIAGVERLSDIAFTDTQREKIRKRVEGCRVRYRRLREAPVGYDTEPPTVFLPGTSESLRRQGRSRKPLRLSEADSVQRPASSDDLAFLPVTALARLIRTRQVSPVELTRLYLDRCSAYGPRLHCIVTLTEDLALKQAKRAEAEIVKGRYRGPLHGIPYGAKDLLATKGIRTTWGATPFEHQVADRDATVVERLHRAGAVLVAKLSMGALAMGPHWFGGTTRNPYNPEQDSSGSSAGPGAATAAGLVGFSIGSETLGSIVSPGHRCGVVGLRPTYGRISRHGAMALSWTMDKLGPMCRGVEDCAAALHAMYGPDGKDRSVADVPFNYPPDRRLSDLRVGYLAAEFEEVKDPAERSADRAALDLLRSLGADLQPVQLPDSPLDAVRMVLFVEAAAAFDDLTRSGAVDVMTDRDKSTWPDEFRTARTVPAVDYLRAQRVRTLLMRDMEALLEKWDLLIAPAFGPNLTVTNLTGHPALLVPCGFPNGLPRGLTLIGALYDEATLLMAGHAYEQATEWHLRRPDLSKLQTLPP